MDLVLLAFGGVNEMRFSESPDLTTDDRLFISTRMVPQGQLDRVEYIFNVNALRYTTLSSEQRYEIARVIGRLNKLLEKHKFIMLGPGRWGSANIDLGVPVSYADIYNSSALIELAYTQKGITPEPSYGTHFFQDLVESQIYPLAVYPDEPAHDAAAGVRAVGRGAESHSHSHTAARPFAGNLDGRRTRRGLFCAGRG